MTANLFSTSYHQGSSIGIPISTLSVPGPRDEAGMESSYEDPLDVRRVLIAFGYKSLLTRRAQKESERCGRTALLARAPI